MRQNCIDCQRPTIRAREIDGNIVIIDAHPVGDGDLAIRGDLGDEPTAFWNFDPETDADFWNMPSSPPLHNKHRCRRL